MNVFEFFTKYGMLLLRLGIIGGLIYSLHHKYIFKDLVRNTEPAEYLVVDKNCKRRGAYISIQLPKGVYRLDYYGKKCEEAKIGGYVKLYYSPENDVFYVPGSNLYDRYIGGLILLFLLTFVPWSKISKPGRK